MTQKVIELNAETSRAMRIGYASDYLTNFEISLN